MCAFLDQHAGAIQALCAVAGVIGLFVYASYTNTIKRATLQQSEASRRPFFRLKDGGSIHQPSGSHTLLLCNEGPGAALDVYWQYCGAEEAPLKIGAVSVGAELAVLDEAGFQINVAAVRKFGISIEYKDLARKKYWTTVAITENDRYVIDTGEID